MKELNLIFWDNLIFVRLAFVRERERQNVINIRRYTYNRGWRGEGASRPEIIMLGLKRRNGEGTTKTGREREECGGFRSRVSFVLFHIYPTLAYRVV